jgi:Icc-related predicted phosphoesterase
MKLVLISDTHGRHPVVPDGDVLIHAGDLTAGGSLAECRKEIEWLKSLPHQHKIFVAGNHDFALEAFMKQGREDLIQDFATPMIYLRDQWTTIAGKYFWGSPWQPWFYDWAFNVTRGHLHEYWDKIPNNIDVLITHGPPKNILDWVGRDRVGCDELRVAVERVKPKIHVFGHIHCAQGKATNGVTTFYNACVVDEAYSLAHPAYEVEL